MTEDGTTMYDGYSGIYARAKPYLDTRQNEVHVAISFSFGQRLLQHYPQADPAVVLPAIILHDVGWKMIPEDQQVKGFGPKIKDPGLRRVHEIEGARLAGEILAEANYDGAKRAAIMGIIDGHDSRETTLSLEDKLVKDSDKLCRFTKTGIEIDSQRFNIPLDEYVEWLGRQIEGWMFTPEARRMAHEAFDESKVAFMKRG